MEYTILNIDTEKGHVTFKLADGIVQKVCDFPVDSPESLENAIVEYAKRYKSPIKNVMDKAVADTLVGKTVVVPVEEVVAPVEGAPEVVAEPIVETPVEAPVEVAPVETVIEEAPVEAPTAEAVVDTTASPVEVVNE